PQPAETPLRVAGLVCVSYPLHPPAQPEKLRVAHLPHVVAPALFVSGTRDEFASPDELTSNLTVMQRAPEVHFVDGARHDLRGKDAIVASLVATWVRGLRA
ncbi:MAG: alpha/beta family hydrolase, partial [Actinomycetota bacterium]